MPLYEYECQECGHRLEAIQKVSDKPLKTCPECQGELERLLSPPAIQFKGTGWYITDYARSAEGKKEKTETEKPAGEKAAASESKKEAKSEAKAKETPKAKPE